MPLPTLNGDNGGDKRDNKSSLPKMPSLPSETTKLPENIGLPKELPSFTDSEQPKAPLPSFDSSERVEDFVSSDIKDEPKDEFSQLPIEDTIEEDNDEEENKELYEEIEKIEEKKSPLPTPSKKEENYQTEEDYNPDYEKDLEEGKKRKFIDKKNKKIIPFGGKKSKKKKFVKSSDFDDRKNLLAKTKIMQFSVISIIVIMFFLGLKNTFLPAHVYTSEQIKQFAAEGAGQTGFPKERGQSFVENFMNSYLTIDPSRPELYEILNVFYGREGAKNEEYGQKNMTWTNDTKQKVIIAPKVYSVELLTDYSAQYKLNAYVSNTDGSVVDGEGSAGRWLSFSVNLYYDKESDTLAITEDSPSLIPSYKVSPGSEVPERAPSGNGEVNEEILPAITPTINGFIEAYAEASRDSHESIIQYIDDKNDINLYDGFDGAVKLNGDPSEAIKKVAYNSDDGIYRVFVTVDWLDTAATQDDYQVGYTSKYIMRVKPVEDGKYAVSSFVPYTYLIEQ